MLWQLSQIEIEIEPCNDCSTKKMLKIAIGMEVDEKSPGRQVFENRKAALVFSLISALSEEVLAGMTSSLPHLLTWSRLPRTWVVLEVHFPVQIVTISKAWHLSSMSYSASQS